MKCSKYFKIIIIITLAAFTFGSTSICSHGHCGDGDISSATGENNNPECSSIDEPCDDCDGHHDENDDHFCPCLCHTPVNMVSTTVAAAFCSAETVVDKLNNVYAPGPSSRLERPPQQS